MKRPPPGQIILDGEAVSLQSTHQAEKLGISIIFQELNLFPNMNVMDNIFMANEFFQKGRINEKYQYALANRCWNGWSWMSILTLRWVNSVSATSS
ncbi:sugar ABC transporter ATP-binding protein [Klebsiella pneumoniae]|uniref:Sugar ABC transporter ATP-binding protein n=1 Tax=Klebsiella pneumoniae TaxID=573 RepID=A0A378F8X9_KLEPN|nr:sugar ABC transporter ATP-binding protein [Klebsiella pneumoniae]